MNLKRGDIVKFTPSLKYVDEWLSGRQMVEPGEIGIVMEVEEPRSIVRVKFSLAGAPAATRFQPFVWNTAQQRWMTGAHEWFPVQFFEWLGRVEGEDATE